MIKQIDTRNHELYQDDTQRIDRMAEFAAEVSESLPEKQAVAVSKINSLTGTPVNLTSRNTAPSDDALISQALKHVQNVGRALGFAPEEPVEFTADPYIQKTSAGVSVVHLHQTYRGIPVFQMARTVRFSNRNELRKVKGDNAILDGNLEAIPVLKVEDAIAKACEYIDANQDDASEHKDGWGQPVRTTTISVSDYKPKVIARFSMPSQPTVLDKDSFGDYIPANLVIFHEGPRSRLGWDFLITLPDNLGQFKIIVAADKINPGEILYVQETTLYAKVKGNVYTHTGADGRQMVDFPRPLGEYPPIPKPDDLPKEFPHDWVHKDKTVGNNTKATLGATEKTLTGKTVNDLLIFDPKDDTGDEQKILNIFYFCNYMHDFFRLLGFDEAAGNFQEINFTGEGAGSDSVNALAHSGAVSGTANMGTPPDGHNPTMNMGLVESTDRHTAFDSDVVFHEFVHGVTNRLVGGRLNADALRAPQSGGMGEGNSDYFALTVQNYFRDEEKVITGDWVTGMPEGIRGFPYNDQFPDNFGNLGTERYSGQYGPHPIGEIWCATLMSMTRHVVAALGKDRGYYLCWQIVVDSYKLNHANPSFLDARDDILEALDDLRENRKVTDQEYATVHREAWKAFAKFGMGPNARSNGASLKGIKADFGLPEDLKR